MRQTNTTWTTLFIIISLFVVLSHLYLEISLIIELYVLPEMDKATKLKFHESLGIFAPGVYLFEGGIALLKSLSPIVKFIKDIILIVNSLVLILAIIFSYYVFKRRLWAGITMSLLAIMPILIWLDL